MARTSNLVALVGCGYSPLTRKRVTPQDDLVVMACLDALNDAGLDPTDVDGILVQGHHPLPDRERIAGSLGIPNARWIDDAGPGVFSLASAAQVLDSSACSSVVVCKAVNTVAPVRAPVIDEKTGTVAGPGQFEVPYGLGYQMQRIGLTARRWMQRYGVTPEQVGSFCIAQRSNALLNPHAFFDTPLSLGEYLSSRFIADPVRLFDCDFPVNGAYAYVMTRGERSARLRWPPVYLLSWATAPHELHAFYTLPEETQDGPTGWLQVMYRDAGMAPKDLDVSLLYDGYSFLALQWMESLGLVPRGRAGFLVEGGHRIRFDGDCPINTHGGSLSEGRTHGAGHILEAVQQLRGGATGRQVAGARRAVVSTAFSNTGAAAILGAE